jgi:uncharacterized membrane protein
MNVQTLGRIVMNKKLIISLFIIINCLSYSKVLAYEEMRIIQTTGEVIEVSEALLAEGIQLREQYVLVRILKEDFKGEIISLENPLLTYPWPDIKLFPGDKVVLRIQASSKGIEDIQIIDFGRSNFIYILVGCYAFLLILIGGLRGLRAITALAVTGFILAFFLLPLLLEGKSPIIITSSILIGITLVTMPIISGINSKTWAATFGTIIGVVTAGLIAYISGEMIHLTGFLDEHAQNLMYFLEYQIDLRGLLFSGIIIGALGATMDVGMSIASAIEEIKLANPYISPFNLFRAGINVGRDILGTMTNTLILAYVGSALPLLLFLMTLENTYIGRINSEFVATEAIRALSGSIGLTFTVPVTSFLCVILLDRNGKDKRKTQNRVGGR